MRNATCSTFILCYTCIMEKSYMGNFVYHLLFTLTEVGETYTSVFDHKPTLRKEIQLFLKEFEVSLRCWSSFRSFGVVWLEN